jgi:hypothetical protein
MDWKHLLAYITGTVDHFESMEMLGIRLLLPAPRPPCPDTNA